MQLELIPNIPTTTKPGSKAEAFWEFHNNNPHVYRNLVSLSWQIRNKDPLAQVGIDMVYAQLRWQYIMKTEIREDEYKLNNNHTSRYARLIMAQEPDLHGLFVTRRLKEDV